MQLSPSPTADKINDRGNTSVEKTHHANSRDRVTQRFFRRRAEDTLPLTLTHDRIYILPTRRGWVFLLSLLLMLITSMNYALGLGYALCFLLCGLFSSALLATYRNLAGISLIAITPHSACVGERVSFTLTLQNPGRQTARMLRIRTKSGDEALLAELKNNDNAEVSIQQDATQRGWQKCGRLTFTSDYPLGLWYSWGYAHVPAEALVYPSPESNPPALTGQSANADVDSDDAPSIRGDSSGIPDAMREYVAGDSPSLINWKASARGNGLYTREFADNAATDTVALDWMQTAMLDDNDQRVSRLCAWVTSCAAQGINWTLQIPEGFFEETTADQTSVPGLEEKARSGHSIDARLPDTLISHSANSKHLLNSLQALALTLASDKTGDEA